MRARWVAGSSPARVKLVVGLAAMPSWNLSLSVSKLACVRGGRLLFRDLNFKVGAGQLLTLEGANGAGKTSLLRVLAGFISPSEGSISVEGAGDVGDAEERGKLIGWFGHQDAAKSQLTPREALGFFAGLYGANAPDHGAMAELGLARVADLPCQYLSAGQKKRLALARLKLCARPIWLLDEPLASLDAEGRELLTRMIGAHRAEGGFAIAATHEPIAGATGSVKL
jgi:heme exporter protein A